MAAPRVSVLMSVYNQGKYLCEAVDSVLNQSYRDFEFIVVDDGSTDATAEILGGYVDSRVRVIRSDVNLGLTRSLNIGLRETRGEYVARMDADDVSHPDRLRREVEFLDSHPDYAVVGTFARILGEDSRVGGPWVVPIEDAEIREYLAVGNCIIHGSAMVRKSSLSDVGLYDESMFYSQDYELWLRLSEKYRLANIPEFLYFVRQHSGRVSVKYASGQADYVRSAKSKALDRRITGILSDVSGGNMSVDDAVCRLVRGVASNYRVSVKWNRFLRLLGVFGVYLPLARILHSRKIRRLLTSYKNADVSLEAVESTLKDMLGEGLPY